MEICGVRVLQAAITVCPQTMVIVRPYQPRFFLVPFIAYSGNEVSYMSYIFLWLIL